MLRVGATGWEAAADSEEFRGEPGAPWSPRRPASQAAARWARRPAPPPGPEPGRPPLRPLFCSLPRAPGSGLRAEVGRRWTGAASVALGEALHGKRSRPSLARELRG